MWATDVQLPEMIDFNTVDQLAERCCTVYGLQITLKGTLARYPGCIHWHWKRGGQSGVLELTAWPQEQRLWFTVHDNRRGGWIDETVAHLKTQLEAGLQNSTWTVNSDPKSAKE